MQQSMHFVDMSMAGMDMSMAGMQQMLEEQINISLFVVKVDIAIVDHPMANNQGE